MKILWRQESACTNSRKTSPASLYYPTNTSTLNSQTSKLTFGNNVSLKTLTILTQRNVDGKWRRIALCQSGSTAPSFHQVCHVGNLADKSTVRRQTGLMTKVRNCLLLNHQRRSNGVKLLNHHHKVIQQCSIHQL